MDASPFHPDELEAQARAGYAPRGAGIRNFMPDQHRSFFPLLPYLFVATTDANGWPLATMLNGRPGFVHAPDPVTLRIDTLPETEDPAAGTFGKRPGDRDTRNRFHHPPTQSGQRSNRRFGRRGIHRRSRPKLRQLREIHSTSCRARYTVRAGTG